MRLYGRPAGGDRPARLKRQRVGEGSSGWEIFDFAFNTAVAGLSPAVICRKREHPSLLASHVEGAPKALSPASPKPGTM